MKVASPFASNRMIDVMSAPNSAPISSATAANTFADGAARATSVATRRSAACSSATRRSSSRASALAIAAATSSVNPASRASVSGGGGCPVTDPTVMKPHNRPPTVIGAMTPDRTPCDASSESSGYRSMRTGCPVTWTRAAGPPSGRGPW